MCFVYSYHFILIIRKENRFQKQIGKLLEIYLKSLSQQLFMLQVK